MLYFSSVAQSCLALCDPIDCCSQASLSITNSQSLLKLMSIESVMPSKHLILCRPLLLLPSIFPSIRIFSSESVLPIRWPDYWNFSFIISSSNEYSGLISFRIDWFNLLAVQGTLKSLLQHHSSKASILGAQLSLWSNFKHADVNLIKLKVVTVGEVKRTFSRFLSCENCQRQLSSPEESLHQNPV